MSARAARRYAKALFLIAREREALEDTGKALARLGAILRQPSVEVVVRNPLLDVAKRTRLAEALADEIQADDLLRRFLALLAEHRRLQLLPAIAAAYEGLLDRAMGRVRAEIVAARPLDERTKADLVAALEHRSGKTVLPEIRIDPELLAGVVVQMESRVFDGSLRTQLRRLAEAMAGGELQH